MRLLVPSSLDALRNLASLTSWLGDQAQVLLLAGHADDRIEAFMVETLQPLVSAIGALRYLILTNVEGSKEIPNWAKLLAAPIALPPLFLQQSSINTLEISQQEKIVLTEFSRLRQIEGATHLVLDALNTETTSTQNRRRLVDPSRFGASPVTSAEGNPRAHIENVMRPFQQDMERVRRAMDEQSAHSLGADGSLYQTILRLADCMSFDGLKQESLAHTIRLSVSAGTLEQLRGDIKKEFSNSLRDDIRQLDDALEASAEVLQTAVTEKTGFTHRIAIPTADMERLRDSLGALVQVNIRYKGEIPRSTWKTRFQGARNWMMGVSMFMMLTAGIGKITSQEAGKGLRDILMVGMLFAFILGLCAAIFGYKKLRAQAIEREMDKLRDAALQELTRLFQSLAGEKRRMIAEQMQRVSREVEIEVNRIFAKQSDTHKTESERVRAIAAEKIRLLDGKLRSLQQGQMACRQIGTEVSQVQSQLAMIASSLPVTEPRPLRVEAAPPSRIVSSSPPQTEAAMLASKDLSPLDSFIPPQPETQNIL